ncbi:MAG: alginate lyase family protein [Ignavibacteriaceae bacterium]|nr:alginate lyase family protein [Ignavibacteriaceae bacterium]
MGYSLQKRLNQCYFNFFAKSIDNSLITQVERNIDNEVFKKSLAEMISIPPELTALINLDESAAILAEAVRIKQGVFNLLGSGDIILKNIDWHKDFKTGFRWNPGTFYKKYVQEGIDTGSDVKVPRELSRCHHFLKLALAYRLTGNEEYAGICVAQMLDWIKENPFMYSINWGCTMDVSIRAVNWIWAIGLITGSVSLNEISIERIKSSLYEHGWFIYRNPEKEYYNNHNHYLADLTGQVQLGLLFNNLDEPKHWLETGKEELFREIRMQILPSGMSYERSTNYNRLVLELLLVPVLILRKNGHEVPQDIWFRLEKMFEFIMYSLKPDGTTPIIGDQDDGRLLPFGCESNIDYRYLLSLGGMLFDRDDFKHHGNGFNIYCALFGGKYEKEKYAANDDNKIALSSRAFPDSGYYIMRKDNNYLIFNAEGKGLYPELASGTHTHSDLLSFELYTQDKSFLVDPGSYVYTADAKERMFFRSSQMHNTVTIDGESQNVIRVENLWDFERNAIPEVLKWESCESYDLVVARHTGFKRLNDPVVHQRSITFDKQELSWKVRDELSGEGCHLFEWFFHFDTGIDFNIKDKEVQTNCGDGKNLLFTFSGSQIIVLRKEESYVSKGYGTKERAEVLVVSVHSNCPLELIISINQI